MITKRGHVIGVLPTPDNEADAVSQLHGFMRGTVMVPPGIDLTEPATDEIFTVEDAVLLDTGAEVRLANGAPLDPTNRTP